AAETKDAIQPIVDTATALDGKMGDLRSAIEAANAKKSTTAYTQASDTSEFDGALTAANTLNSDKGDNEDANAVQAKIDALTNAKLDGDKQLQDAKDAAIEKINALENLNKAQKQAAIAQVNAAETKDAIQPIVDTATALDGKMG
ncbi:GA module-containing protein, partial [Lactobacillus mulieris]